MRLQKVHYLAFENIRKGEEAGKGLERLRANEPASSLYCEHLYYDFEYCENRNEMQPKKFVYVRVERGA